MKNKTLVVGTAFVDIKGFAAGKYDPIGRNVGKIEYCQGGVARNIAENMANIGMPVSFLSMADNNSTGNDVVKRLESAGVDTQYILRCASSGNGVWLAVMNEAGDLAGSISQTPDFDMFEKHIESVGKEAIAQCGSVVLEIDLNSIIAKMVLDLAGDAGVPVYAVVGNLSVVLAHPEYLSMTECFICNEIEAGKLMGCELVKADLETILKAAKECAEKYKIPSVMVTAGSSGSVYFDRKTGTGGIQNVVETDVLDTCGAGDAFFSGASSALIRGCSVKDAAKYGAVLASKTIAWTENSCPVIQDFFKNA